MPESVEDSYVNIPNDFRGQYVPLRKLSETDSFTLGVRETSEKKGNNLFFQEVARLGASGKKMSNRETLYGPCAHFAELTRNGDIRVTFDTYNNTGILRFGKFNVINKDSSNTGHIIEVSFPEKFVHEPEAYLPFVPEIIESTLLLHDEMNHEGNKGRVKIAEISGSSYTTPAPGESMEVKIQTSAENLESTTAFSVPEIDRDLFTEDLTPWQQCVWKSEDLTKLKDVVRNNNQKSPDTRASTSINGQEYAIDTNIYSQWESNRLRLVPNDFESNAPILELYKVGTSEDEDTDSDEIWLLDIIKEKSLTDGGMTKKTINYREDGSVTREMGYLILPKGNLNFEQQTHNDAKFINLHYIASPDSTWNTLVLGTYSNTGIFEWLAQYNYLNNSSDVLLLSDYDTLVGSYDNQNLSQKIVSVMGPKLLDRDVKFQIKPRELQKAYLNTQIRRLRSRAARKVQKVKDKLPVKSKNK